MLSLNHFLCLAIATAPALAAGYNEKNKTDHSSPVSMANTYTDNVFKSSIKI